MGLVALGGAAGVLARDLLDAALPARGGVPAGILIANLVGAFALGLLVEALGSAGPPTLGRVRARLLLGTGFLGALTTYSSLIVGSGVLALDRSLALAAGYLVATVVLGLLATGAGVAVGGHRRRSRAPEARG